MLRNCTLLFACLLFSISNLFTQGVIKESLAFKSDILKKDVRYSIYFPEDYGNSNRFYPTIYLLHGYTDNETAWAQFGEIQNILNKGIAAGTLPPMVVIMPDAEVTWYVNNSTGEIRYEDMFFEELIPYMEKTYRLRSKKEFRGISGLSMGGYGSLIYALRHPEMFAAAAPLSAAIYTQEDAIKEENKEWNYVFGNVFGKAEGKDRITEHFKSYDPFELIQQKENLDQIKTVGFYFDCGDDDFLSEGNAAFHIAMKKAQIPHEFRMRDGAHNWTYWRTGVGVAFEFIGKYFKR